MQVPQAHFLVIAKGLPAFGACFETARLRVEVIGILVVNHAEPTQFLFLCVAVLNP